MCQFSTESFRMRRLLGCFVCVAITISLMFQMPFNQGLYFPLRLGDTNLNNGNLWGCEFKTLDHRFRNLKKRGPVATQRASRQMLSPAAAAPNGSAAQLPAAQL
jgi:hypothetical protein